MRRGAFLERESSGRNSTEQAVEKGRQETNSVRVSGVEPCQMHPYARIDCAQRDDDLVLQQLAKLVHWLLASVPS